jgi:hypothetical protein
MSTQQGSCHCGAVRFTVEGPLDTPIACNCSICGRSGSLYAFVPAARFTLVAGEEVLRDYQFGKRHIHHRFCTNCGIRPFADGEDPGGGGVMVGVNVRCLEGVDVRTIEPVWYDGASL